MCFPAAEEGWRSQAELGAWTAMAPSGAPGWGWGVSVSAPGSREVGPSVTGSAPRRDAAGPAQPRKPNMNFRWMASDGFKSDLFSVCGSRPRPFVFP